MPDPLDVDRTAEQRAAHHDPSGNATYDYRYICGSGSVDVLWRPADTIHAILPVAAGKQVTLIYGNGTQQALSPVGGGVALTIGQSPILIRQADPPRITVTPTSVTLLAELGAATAAGGLQSRRQPLSAPGLDSQHHGRRAHLEHD